MSIAETMHERAELFARRYHAVREQIGRVIVGHDEIVHGVLTCLFVGGHCLLEGVPGLGKTLLVRTLAEALDLDFSRIQFTPDLMPADILGTNMVMEDARRAGGSSSFSAGRSSRRSAWPTKSTAPRPRRSRPCSKRCRKARSPSAGISTCSKSRSSSWPRRTRSSRKEPIRCPRRSSTGSSSSWSSAIRAARSWPRSSTAPRAASGSSRAR